MHHHGQESLSTCAKAYDASETGRGVEARQAETIILISEIRDSGAIGREERAAKSGPAGLWGSGMIGHGPSGVAAGPDPAAGDTG